MKRWFSGLLVSIAHVLDNARATCHRILALNDLILCRVSPSSAALGHAGRGRSMPGREGEGVVV